MTKEEPVWSEDRARMHNLLYSQISLIPNGRDFLHAVNEGLTKMKTLELENERLSAETDELKLKISELNGYLEDRQNKVTGLSAEIERLKKLILLTENTWLVDQPYYWCSYVRSQIEVLNISK